MKYKNSRLIFLPEKELKLWYDEEVPYGNEGISKAYAGTNEYKDIPDDGWEKWSLPLGNAYSGVNVFGRTYTERIQITDNTLSSPLAIVDWLDGDRRLSKRLFGGGLNSFSETYLDFGHPHDGVTEYRRELDLRTAVSAVNYTYNGVKYRREYFTSYPDKAIVIYLEASGEGNLNFTLRPTIPYKQEYMVKEGDGFSKSGTVVANDDGIITLSGNLGYCDIDFVGKYKIVNDGGTVTASNGTNERGDADNGTLTVRSANSAYIIITLSTSVRLSSDVFTTADPKDKFKKSGIDALAVTEAELSAASAYSYSELRKRHIADYERLFGRVDIDLGGKVPQVTTDELLADYVEGNCDAYLEELYFQFGRYLLISSSREGSLPANLQGTWNRYNLAPWGSGYWHNINVQMNYWHAFSTNLSETFHAYTSFWKAFLPKAQELATAALSGEKHKSNLGIELRCDSAASNRYKEKLGKDGGNGWTIGVGNQAFEISSSPGCGNVGFTMQMFWDYYDFTRNEEALRDTVYPALKGASQFITKTFAKEEDGKYLSIWGDSPEQWVNGVWYYTKGTTYDQSFAYTNGYYTLKAAELLGIKATDEGESILATIAEQLPNYDPIVVGYSGQVKEFREEDYYGDLGEYAHRHISQLVGLYPGNIINSTTPAWIDAAKYTLSQREMGTAGDSWGWSIAHRQNLWARVGDGDQAYNQYQKLLTMRTAANLWDMSPAGFQIDGNFGGTAGVAEMLLQSQSGYIEPLAAIPSAWSDGSYTGLVARGNFEVSAKWEDGNAKVFNIISNAGGLCQVKHGGLANAIVLTESGATVSHTQVSKDIISFDTEVGETYIICNLSDIEKVEAPTELTVSALDKNNYALSWTASSDAVKYNVYKAIENDSDYTFVGTTDETACVYTTSEDEENKRTTYRVTAVSESGAESDGALAYVNPIETDVISVDMREVDGKLQFAIDTDGTHADLYRVYEKLDGGSYQMVAESEISVISLDGYDLANQYAITTVCGYFESDKLVVSPKTQNSFGEYSENVLLHKPVTYEGLEAWSSSFVPEKVTDGITYATRASTSEGRFSSKNSDNVTPSVFTIDLNGVYELNDFTIDNYDSAFRYTDVKIEAFYNGEWTTAAERTLTVGIQSDIYSLNGIKGEKLRITIINTANTQAITMQEFICSGTLLGESYETSKNVFLNKTVTTLSSSTGIISGYEIGKVTDGIYSSTRPATNASTYGRFATNNGANNSHSFIIELDGVYSLDTLTIDRWSNRLSYAKFELYYDGEWTTVIEDGKDVTDAFLTSTVYSIGNKKAERVRVTLGNNVDENGTTIQEIMCSGKRISDSKYYGNLLSKSEATDYTGPTPISGYEIDKLTDGLSRYNWEHHSKGRFSSGYATTPSVSVVYNFDGIYRLDNFNMELYSGSAHPVNHLKIEIFYNGEWTTAHEANYGTQTYFYIDLNGALASKVRLTFKNNNTESTTVTINEASIAGERVAEFNRISATDALDDLWKTAAASGDSGYTSSARMLILLANRTIADLSYDETKVKIMIERAKDFASLDLGDVSPSDIIFNYQFGSDDSITEGVKYYLYAENDAGASNYMASESDISSIEIRNNYNGYSIVNDNGNYVLKRGAATQKSSTYVNFFANCDGFQPSHLANYANAGRSFVFEFDVKTSSLEYDMTLLQFITRASSSTVFASILSLSTDGKVYATNDSSKATITTLSADEYTKISVFVDVANNKFYVFVDGVNATPDGYTFLTDTQWNNIAGTYTVGTETITLNAGEFIFGEARVLSGSHNQNIEIYMDNVTAYYAYNCEHDAKISGAQVSIGDSLAVKYYVSLCQHAETDDYSMKFSMNGKETLVSEYTKSDDGRLIFAFRGIAPQCMGDNIKAELICGEEVVNEKDGYSVKTNLTALLANDGITNELKALIYDMLIYGAASQKYVNYNIDNLVTDGVDGLSASNNTPENTDTELSESINNNISFKSAGVVFDYNNRLYIKINASDITDVKVFFGSTELGIENLGDGVYIAYSDAIKATSFSTVYTFTLKVGDDTVQTLKYSVNSYAYAKYSQTDGSGNATGMAELALALYRYGASAEAYSKD